MLPGLTEREREVLKLIAHGFTNKEISCHLVISVSTVQNHVHYIYEKLGISNRAQAVAYALQLRIVLQTDTLEIDDSIHDRMPGNHYNFGYVRPLKPFDDQ